MSNVKIVLNRAVGAEFLAPEFHRHVVPFVCVALGHGQRIGQPPAGKLQIVDDVLRSRFAHQHVVYSDWCFSVDRRVESVLAGLGLFVQDDVDTLQHTSSSGLWAPILSPTPRSRFSSFDKYNSPTEPPDTVQLCW